MASNRAAFLSMIAHSEGTDRAADPYRVCYGFGHTVVDFTDHPAVTGEWTGESLANLGPTYAHSISTAAGRYQINKPTWLELKQILKLPQPPYFSPICQDAAAIVLIRERGALDLIDAGQIEPAIARLRDTWASLPGGNSGQHENSLAYLADFYTGAGGALA